MGGRAHRGAIVSADVRWQRDVERWMALIRVGGVALALFQIGLLVDQYPAGYEAAAWTTTGVLAAGAGAFALLSRRDFGEAGFRRLGLVALGFDTAVVSAYVLIYAFQPGTPIRQLLFVPVFEAALRFGLRGGVILPFLLAPVYAAFEWRRSELTDARFEVDYITFSVGVGVISGLIVGWLVNRLWRQTEVAQARAAEAERLRDRLGRRVDLLEAAGRCARALGSSLELDEAFGAFIRELEGFVPFDRVAIVLAEGGTAQVMAVSGRGADELFPPGTRRAVAGSLLEEVLAGETVYRENMAESLYPEEEELLRLGLHCRVAAPLLAGARSIGMISVVRAEPRSFSAEEVELLSLLGRFVATAVQNIRAYEAERTTVEELRRLSALRADFVSLVSHELRSPMATVIGSARTLQQRWRELRPEQRESFLALIADETNRLATLIADVLDTSRIEAGTFSYAFGDVDIAELVREVAATAAVGQDEVPVRATIVDPIPTIRGDRERLRQVIANLIDNAVKYSPAGEPVEVTAATINGRAVIDVSDRGPGIASEDQTLIFEKFGRARTGKTLPGTGLGLFIARSIVEAHGGSLDVRSAPAEGATFTLELPAA
jgi:signal transduction histidine kinase